GLLIEAAHYRVLPLAEFVPQVATVRPQRQRQLTGDTLEHPLQHPARLSQRHSVLEQEIGEAVLVDEASHRAESLTGQCYARYPRILNLHLAEQIHTKLVESSFYQVEVDNRHIIRSGPAQQIERLSV